MTFAPVKAFSYVVVGGIIILSMLEEKGRTENATNDEVLLRQSLKQPARYEELVNRYRPAFFRRARRLLGNCPEVEEAVADTFVKIYFKATSFESRGQGSFRSWAYRILTNTTLSYSRRRHQEQLRQVNWEEAWFDEFVDEAGGRFRTSLEVNNFVAVVLGRLPERLAKVLQLRFFDGYSLKEIAKSEQLTVGAVKTCLYRAKKEFRRLSTLLGY